MDLKGHSILLVDDDPDIRTQLSLRLGETGCKVALAENGRDALTLLETQSYDLILLDIIMPATSGLEVLETIRQTRSMIAQPIIMLSALDENSDVIHAMSLGANDYIIKGLDWRVMFSRIQTHLSMRRLTEMNEQLMRVATHDLKKPLMLIRDIVTVTQEEMQQEDIGREELQQRFSAIDTSANFMQHIIADFLELDAVENRRLKLHMVSADLNQLAQNTVERNERYAAKKKIKLVLDLTPQLPEVIADWARMEQVMENIVDNALKFSPPQTKTVVRTLVQDDWVVIEVSDEGPGIPPAAIDRAFRKFSTLGNAPTGSESSTGLGLAICKQLMEAQSGEIGLRNNKGRGATFFVRLLASRAFPGYDG